MLIEWTWFENALKNSFDSIPKYVKKAKIWKKYCQQRQNWQLFLSRQCEMNTFFLSTNPGKNHLKIFKSSKTVAKNFIKIQPKFHPSYLSFTHTIKPAPITLTRSIPSSPQVTFSPWVSSSMVFLLTFMIPRFAMFGFFPFISYTYKSTYERDKS